MTDGNPNIGAETPDGLLDVVERVKPSQLFSQVVPQLVVFSQAVLNKGRRWTNELLCRADKGRHRRIECHAVRVPVGEGHGLLMSLRDVEQQGITDEDELEPEVADLQPEPGIHTSVLPPDALLSDRLGRIFETASMAAAALRRCSPCTVNKLPRQKMSTCSRLSICFRCSSNWPHRLASRSVSAGSSSKLSRWLI